MSSSEYCVLNIPNDRHYTAFVLGNGTERKLLSFNVEHHVITGARVTFVCKEGYHWTAGVDGSNKHSVTIKCLKDRIGTVHGCTKDSGLAWWIIALITVGVIFVMTVSTICIWADVKRKRQRKELDGKYSLSVQRQSRLDMQKKTRRLAEERINTAIVSSSDSSEEELGEELHTYAERKSWREENRRQYRKKRRVEKKQMRREDILRRAQQKYQERQEYEATEKAIARISKETQREAILERAKAKYRQREQDKLNDQAVENGGAYANQSHAYLIRKKIIVKIGEYWALVIPVTRTMYCSFQISTDHRFTGAYYEKGLRTYIPPENAVMIPNGTQVNITCLNGYRWTSGQGSSLNQMTVECKGEEISLPPACAIDLLGLPLWLVILLSGVGLTVFLGFVAALFVHMRRRPSANHVQQRPVPVVRHKVKKRSEYVPSAESGESYEQEEFPDWPPEYTYIEPFEEDPEGRITGKGRIYRIPNDIVNQLYMEEEKKQRRIDALQEKIDRAEVLYQERMSKADEELAVEQAKKTKKPSKWWLGKKTSAEMVDDQMANRVPVKSMAHAETSGGQEPTRRHIHIRSKVKVSKNQTSAEKLEEQMQARRRSHKASKQGVLSKKSGAELLEQQKQIHRHSHKTRKTEPSKKKRGDKDEVKVNAEKKHVSAGSRRRQSNDKGQASKTSQSRRRSSRKHEYDYDDDNDYY